MNRTTGRSAFLALLKDEGITHLFGNPGTTELPIMHALKEHPDLTYVLGLQESVVVAMADGYSRASGRLVACNVHVAPGLGNAMGSLYNAKFTGTPEGDAPLSFMARALSSSPSRTSLKSILRPSRSTRLTCTRTRVPMA